MDLFDAQATEDSGVPAFQASAPLAVRMRPTGLDEVVGQDHLLGEGSPLRRLLEPAGAAGPAVSSIILWGPPGTGKTTLAYLVARASGRHFDELSAVSSGVKDIRDVVAAARRRRAASGEDSVLFVDEIHRFSKSQQDALLPAVENRWVTLIGATTENPSFSVISPLLSRSLLVTLRPLDEDSIRALLDRALADERGLAGAFALAEDAKDALVRLAGSDARKSLTLLEAAAGAAAERGTGTIGVDEVQTAANQALVRWDRDQHYDVASAFIKSMRGSDVDAAIHYLARMIEAGEDPRFIARRVMICAAEDVGMAAPEVLPTTVAAAQAVAMIGMPEARILLAEAVVAVATAPKSNASYLAIDQALSDLRSGKGGPVPAHLRDAHYAGAGALGHGEGYVYAHDAPHSVAAQQYLPDDLVGTRYYLPTENGNEAMLTKRLARLRELLGMR
ncbi:MAG: replication-associated recombination protein A [Actinomyces sp.]|jgi:putative ATPase|nr:replication-associated recombination protein A [Actinomyces sp.]MCI1641104.1 replication-associated recombination protein A [Actinomyces sp.]MCI1662377.1 replication-associated recombination protein A [Actinomyces sp.]MCI1691101.1 replication-associated recombination protein A [Actinomyces sp.]MCI1787121.1 replication-associated recombination protein A [Actinomyces sp.]MCI1829313.1 replication-associated recombination protein A [Actinomyces sp.]